MGTEWGEGAAGVGHHPSGLSWLGHCGSAGCVLGQSSFIAFIAGLVDPVGDSVEELPSQPCTIPQTGNGGQERARDFLTSHSELTAKLRRELLSPDSALHSLHYALQPENKISVYLWRVLYVTGRGKQR